MHSLSGFHSQIKRYKRILTTLCSLPLTKSFQNSGDQSITFHLLLPQASSMAGSYENISGQDQTAHSSLLAVKQHQNFVNDLEPIKYDAFMLPIVKCLKYSPLTIVLTKMENVPLSLLSRGYSTSNYIKEE